ncbi:MAG: hypothetical protein HY072_07455, partial [Deltaproteobacteria bacterium]|nr:hypothetical protein [Deltaproteobacteria bacterium]
GVLVFIGVAFVAVSDSTNIKEVAIKIPNSLVAAVVAPTSLGKYNLEDLFRHLAGKAARVVNIKKLTWAGHEFETGVLSTGQYKTDGNKDVKFTESGFYAPSYALPRSKLMDVNLNEKVKVKIAGTFEGQMDSPNTDCTGFCMTKEKYHFSEFGIYLIDESGNRQGIGGVGTREYR